MHRRFSSLVGKGKAGPSNSVYDDDDSDKESKTSTIVKPKEEQILPPPSLKVKRVDHYYSRWYKGWRYRNTSSKVTVEHVPVTRSGENDIWKDFAFVVVRKMPRMENMDPTFKVVLKSPYLVQACKDVIKSWPGISWNSDPLEVEPEMLLIYIPYFTEYIDKLSAKKVQTDKERYIIATTSLLLSTLQSDYKNTLGTISRLHGHREITFDFLYSILVPKTTFVTRCAITGLPRLFELQSSTRVSLDGIPCYQLNLESYDLIDRAGTQTVTIGRVQTQLLLRAFKGTVHITALDAFPLKFHDDPQGLKDQARERGKKWVSLIGVHHRQFEGLAALKVGDCKLLRHSVKGRIMVDRAMFKKFNPNYKYPVPAVVPLDPQAQAVQQDYNDGYPNPSNPPPQVNAASYANGLLVESQIGTGKDDALENMELDDDQLLLTSTVVHGFSFSDKLWLEFDVTQINPVNWNTEAFSNLVLPTSHKELLQALVEAHHHDIGFDDFIRGKGHGLVMNLFGPPGVGKTFSAEATSEHVKRPLYLVGAGDLGTDAAKLDLALEKVLEIATAWKAIVLIDEADVFLEQRSLHDLERNAMVAVFLRHIEYYRGILFLTTNRVKAFDEAFLSRIHVALHFHELPYSSRLQVWNAFISKLGASHSVTQEQIAELAKREVNGRQIKNAARTAKSLALGKGEELKFEHLRDTLDAMSDFTREFEGMTRE